MVVVSASAALPVNTSQKPINPVIVLIISTPSPLLAGGFRGRRAQHAYDRTRTFSRPDTENRAEPTVAPLFKLCFLDRPSEELYDLEHDPHQVRNVAADPAYAEAKRDLAERLTAYLKRTDDPRELGHGDMFDEYPFWLRPGEK